MNGYVAAALGLAFIVWSGFIYYEGTSKESAECASADGKHDLAQAGVTITNQAAVAGTVAKQQTATQGVTNAYEAKKSDIDNQYAADGRLWPARQIASAGDSGSTVPNTPVRSDATPARPLITKVYKLSAKECDDNTAQLYGLQDWIRAQQAVPTPGI